MPSKHDSHFALSIETSGRLGSVALSNGVTILEERSFVHGLQHAAEMIPLIDAITRGHGLAPRQIGVVYVSAGPGSFTGLRIGITFAKTFALSAGAKIVAVPTVKVLAENAPLDAKNIVVLLDAKRGEIFTARFHRQDNQWMEDEPAHLDTLAGMLSRAPRPVHLLGEGVPYHRDAIADAADIEIAPEICWRARAGAVAQLGYAMAQRGEVVNPVTLIPIYVRKPEAEEKWDKMQARLPT